MIEFNAEKHQYTLDGRPLISVTQLMRKHGLAPDYSGIDPAVLERAAERGTLVHKEIEECIKRGAVGFTDEAAAFEQYVTEHAFTCIESEVIVYNDICAGTVDLILDTETERIIADIKTTSALHVEAVSWQLSIYAYICKEIGLTFDRAQAFHFTDGALKVVDIPFKPFEEVDRLMQCEREGKSYQQALDIITPQQVAAIEAAEKIIAQAEAEKKAAEDMIAEIKAALIAEMEKRALKTVETDRVKITYVLPITRNTIDAARLKKERPEIAEEYSKITQTGASVRITLKEVQDAGAR